MNRLYPIFAILLFVVGCTKSDLDSAINSQNLYSPEFYAGFEGYDSRTYLDENLIQRWVKGDSISVFTSTHNQKYKFNGETGDNSGTFSVVPTSQTTQGGNLAVDANFAVYPYNENITVKPDGTISLELPSYQRYVKNSFDASVNHMVAMTGSRSDTDLRFRNLCGYLRLRLYGDDVTISSLYLYSNNGEKISGQAIVNPASDSELSLTMTENASGHIYLDCGEGVKIGTTADEATDFWFIVAPVFLEAGFQISINDNLSGYDWHATWNQLRVERNVIESMEPIEVKPNGVYVERDTYYVGTEGGYVDIDAKITGTSSVEIPEEYRDWISYVKPTKAVHKETFRFKIEPLDAGQERSGSVIIYSSTDQSVHSRWINIIQNDVIVTNEKEHHVGEWGGWIGIGIREHIKYRITIPEDVTWIHADENNDPTSHWQNYYVDENTTYDAREAKILVTNTENNKSDTVTVYQVQRNVMEAEKHQYYVDTEGGYLDIKIQISGTLKVEIPEQDKIWISYVEPTRALQSEVVRFKIAPSENGKERRSEIFIGSDNVDYTTGQWITIMQSDVVVTNEKEHNLEEWGGWFVISIREDIEYKITIPEDVDWIHADENNAPMSHWLGFYVDSNSGYESRKAEIVVTNKKNNKSDIVTVTQMQKNAIVVAQNRYSVNSKGGNIEIEVGHNVEFDIEISADWITQVQTRGFVTDTLVFTIAPNTTLVSRRGTIKFISKDGSITQTVTIDQAKGNTFSPSVDDWEEDDEDHGGAAK